MIEPNAYEELADDLLRFPFPTHTLPPATRTNHYVVGTALGWMLVDAAAANDETAATAVSELRRVLGPGALQGIILSHHHPDHCNYALYMADRLDIGRIYAHASTWKHITEKAVPASVRETVGGEGDTNIPGLELFHTPGHASGLLCARVGSGEFYAGDMVAGVGTILVDPDDGDVGQYLDSLRLLQSMSPASLHPSHGQSIHNVDQLLEYYIAHRLKRHGQVWDALDRAGRTLREVAELAYADTPAAFPILTERSTLAHLRWMQRTHEARCSEDGYWTRI
jgi:glyoxylase-like metal-dependent hydrolase (beta-lactamase superfamily II)